MSFIRSQRETCTTSGTAGSGGDTVAHDVCSSTYPGVRLCVDGDEPRGSEDCANLVGEELLVLGSERIDRGWDRPQPRTIDPFRSERLA